MLVSVIIPTYNRARTIGRALNSVFTQTYGPLEVIVVDDGSTDGTVEALAAYGDKIRVVRQSNQGPAAARNSGIKAASGEIITFLDDDDSWLPDKIERQVKLLQSSRSAGVKCCVCNANMTYPTGTVTSFSKAGLHPTLPEGIWMNPTEVLIDRFVLFNQVIAVWREALEEAGCFRQDLWLMEDYDLALRLSLLGPWAFIAEPLVIWHGDANSNSSQFSQLEQCQTTFQILSDLQNSTRFGPLLPEGRLIRRMRILKNKLTAFRLSGHSNPVTGLCGKSLFLYARGIEAAYMRLPTTGRMITRSV